MARAKRTDRTEARRRNRITSVAPADATMVAAGTQPGPASRTGTGATSASRARTAVPSRTAASPVERPSITGALRGAVRPLDLRGDLRALPRLLLHWSFWGPALGTLVTTALFIALSQGRSSTTPQDTVWVVVNLAFQMFVFPLPAPAGASFIAGFGAPRASWLIGLLIGIIAAACFAVVLSTASSTLTSPTSTVDISGYALQGFLVAPIGSALFATAAAWYKRFLNLANPNRTQRAQQQQRPQHGRGNITRDRLSR